MIDLKDIIKSSEKVNIEVKAAQGGLPNSIWETYSSFANTFGGTIILGIGEDKETKKLIPLGISDADKMITDIWNILNNPQKVSKKILLERNVYKQQYEGKDYVIIEVPRATRSSKPIYIGTDMFKGTYRRNHEGDYLCTDLEVKTMIRDSLETSADSAVLDNVGLDALNSDSIKSYRSRFEIIRSGHTWNGLPNDEFLIKIGAARVAEYDGKIHPTLGGLIFFGDFINIMNELPNFFLDYREKLAIDTRWSDRVCSGDGDWSGNVYDFYFKIVDRLTSDVKKPFVINNRMLRDDDTDIHKSLREALANALIHADYYGRQGVVIKKEFRKMTFSNPGLCRINIDDAIAGGTSDARNSRIFNMFALIKVGERSGMGLCDIYNYWDAYGYEKPIIKETLNPDRFTLILQIEYANSEAKTNADSGTLIGANKGENANPGTSIGANTCENANLGTSIGANKSENDSFDTSNGLKLSENERAVYNYIKMNSSITTKAISEELGVPLRTTQRYLATLKEKGLVIRNGTKKTGKWVIL